MVSISMVRRLALALSLGITMTAVAACGGDGGSDGAAASFCGRAAECDFLSAEYSQQECVDDLQKSLESATETQQDEWAKEMDECLGEDACQDFFNCVQDKGLVVVQ